MFSTDVKSVLKIVVRDCFEYFRYNNLGWLSLTAQHDLLQNRTETYLERSMITFFPSQWVTVCRDKGPKSAGSLCLRVNNSRGTFLF